MSNFDLNYVLKKTQQELMPRNQGSIGPLPPYSDPIPDNKFDVNYTIAKTERMFENQRREQAKTTYEQTFKPLEPIKPIEPTFKPFNPIIPEPKKFWWEK